MDTQFLKLKRRPFLLPLLMPLAMFAVAVVVALWLFDARTSTIIIAVRHAEVADVSEANPELNAAGKLRAQSLLTELGRAKPRRGVDAVYVARGQASQQTAEPLARQMGLAMNVVATSEWDSLPGRIARNHAGEVVLVVADTANLAAFLHRYTAVDYPLDAIDASGLFVIVRSGLSKTAVVRLRY